MIDKKPVQTYLAVVAITIAGLYVVHSLDISYPLSMRTSSASTELSVVGEGEVDAVPDIAQVGVGIQVANVPTAEEAQNQIAQVNNDLIKAMTSLGIDKKDLVTSNYSVFPGYSAENSRISSYNGNATVTIKVRNMEKLASVITAATNSGTNQVQGISFSIDDPSQFREAARKEAIADARAQAEKLAKDLDIKLGKVVNVIESQSCGGPITYYAKSADFMTAETVESPIIEPGTQTVTSTVTLFFEKR